jgi:uridine kinase
VASPEPTDSSRRIADLVLDRSPTLGAYRLVCVDGPSGSGKTTLAARVAAELESRGCTVAVVHMDDLYDGWGGLQGSGPLLHEQLLAPLSRGRPGSYRRYDWHREERAETRTVQMTDVLVVEGVGSWRRAHARLVTVLVWVEAPAAVRLERAVRRDGSDLAPDLLVWQRDEDRLHEAEATRDHADLVVTTDDER